jgi:hypothetical protein
LPTTTSRLLLSQPVGAEAPSQIRVANAANMAILDNAVTFSEGTISSRPAAGLAGRVYYATDTGQYFIDTGSAWTAFGYQAASAAFSIDGSGLTTATVTVNLPNSFADTNYAAWATIDQSGGSAGSSQLSCIVRAKTVNTVTVFVWGGAGAGVTHTPTMSVLAFHV